MNRLEKRLDKLEEQTGANQKSMSLVIIPVGATIADAKRLKANAVENSGLEADEVKGSLITINIVQPKPASAEIIPIMKATRPEVDIADLEPSGLVKQPWMSW